MSSKRDAVSMAGKMREYLKSHPGQTTTQIAAGLGWTGKRVSAAVWAEMGRPDSQVVRVELPIDGPRRTPKYSYYHKDNAVVGAKVQGESPDAETTKPEWESPSRPQLSNYTPIKDRAIFVEELPQPPTEKPAISLDDFADMLALAIAKRVVSRVQSQLERQLQTILPAVGANVAPISIEALTSRLAPVEDTKTKKASVLIAGLLPNQAGIIDTEFGDCFDLRYFMTDDNLRHLKSMAKSVDHVFTFTSKVSHAVEEVMVGQGHKIHRCSGGMTMLKDQLFKLYAEGTV